MDFRTLQLENLIIHRVLQKAAPGQPEVRPTLSDAARRATVSVPSSSGGSATRSPVFVGTGPVCELCSLRLPRNGVGHPFFDLQF